MKKTEKSRKVMSARKALKKRHAARTGQAVDFVNGLLVYAGSSATPVKAKGGQPIEVRKGG